MLNRTSSPRAMLVGAALAVLLAFVGGSAALQLRSGGIRTSSLGPVVLAFSLCALGGILVVHRPRMRLGRVLTVSGLGFGLGALAASALDFGSVHPIPTLAAQASFATASLTRVLIASWVLFILWFPDDRFTSRAWRRFSVVAAVTCVAVAVATWLVGPPDHVFDFYGQTAVPPGAGGPFAGAFDPLGGLSDLLLLLPLVAIGSLVQRYRRGGPVVAQQIRWLLVAAIVSILIQLVGVVLVWQHSTAGDAGLVVGAVAQPLPILAATLAILRYRLWEIDVALSRALVYGVLWAALTALLLVPPLAAGLLVGGRGALAAVVIALLVTVIFRPARRRLERVGEHLVFRRPPRPYELLTGFWERLRTADLEEVGLLLADAVRGGLGVSWAGTWLYSGTGRGGSLRALGVAGVESGPPVVVSAATVSRLLDSPGLVFASAVPGLSPKQPAAVVPLVAADELVGVLACGRRRGNPLGPADYELLELLARECALRLRNLRLEVELRERLAQIEAQADELQDSRRRLVAVQDEERRRIERNLHDGVQQQLVALAVRLHRTADGDPVLADLAAEAEQAVFALQELGRGIFPGVLVDQGLPAALRTQAARLPLSVRIEVDPALAGRRLDPELEAALYFIALEGLTNVQKHAPDASVAVWLRTDDAEVVLDVVDDGPGCDGLAGSGTGLQNMADRIAAVGGTFALDSRPGQGTRITAAVLVAEPLRQVDSRR